MNIEMVKVSEQSDYEKERNKPMPSKNHSITQKRLIINLDKQLGEKYEVFPEVEIALKDSKPTVPDISIYPKMKIDFLEDEIRMSEPPITTIEILSPTQSVDELKNKIFKTYFIGGVKSAWLVIPTLKTIHVFTPDRKNVVFNTGILQDPTTNIQLDLKNIF